MALVATAGQGAGAQRVNAARLAVAASPAESVHVSDSLPTSAAQVHVGRAVAGGLAGGLVGAAAGAYVGARSATGCRGELCRLGPAALGLAIGESIGVGVGTHLGAGGRGNMGVAVLVSSISGAAGILISAASGGVLIPLVPVLQVAVVLGMEG
jgi:hypothetical protein